MADREAVYLGLDVGGTKVAVGAVSPDGGLRSRLQVPTSELRAGRDPLSALIRLGHQALEGVPGSLAGVGIALPGPVERAAVRMLAAPTIPEFEGVSLTGALQDTFGCPVAGDNDANGCALAEARFGAGCGHGQVVYFTVSTGIGGGIVCDGRVLRGSRGTSAEFGHQVILPFDGPACDCGNTGCLEALASGRGIARRASAAGASMAPSPSWAHAEVAPDAAEVAAAARAGDPVAQRVWNDTALYLGLGVSNVINVLDPDVVVIGGGVAAGAGDLLFEPVRRVVRERCMPRLGRDTPVVPARLGSEVGIVGAVCLLLEALEEGGDPGLKPAGWRDDRYGEAAL